MKFIEDPLIEFKRSKYWKEYNDNFNKIILCKKNSEEHFVLLKKEKRIQLRTSRFMKINAFYYTMKRKKIFEDMEEKGFFGNKPETDKLPEEYELRRYNRFETRPLSRSKQPCCGVEA